MITSNTTLRYSLYFALTYAALVITINLIVNILGLNIGNAANVGALMGAVAFSATKFATREKRPVERKENLKITLACLGFAYLVSIALAIVVSILLNIDLMEIVRSFSPMIMAAALAIISLIYTAVIYFTFGWFVKMMLKQAQK